MFSIYLNIKKNMKVKLIKPERRDNSEYNALINRCNEEFSRAILEQTVINK